MKSSLSELNNEEVIKYWNQKISNKQLCEKLDAPWPLVNSKAKRVKAVADKLTQDRTPGINGTFIKKEETAAAAAAPAKKTAKSSTRAVSSIEAAEEAHSDFKLNVKLMSSQQTAIEEKPIVGPNLEAVITQIQNMMREHRITKCDIYRNGSIVTEAELQYGDSITLRPQINAA